MESQDPGFYKSRRSRDSRESSSSRRHQPTRMPSTSGYMLAAAAAAVTLFFLLWWMLQSEDSPWIPAGLAASVVMLVAASAREVVMRRAWVRHIMEEDRHGMRRRSGSARTSRSATMQSANLHGAALRAIQKQSADADADESLPEVHREIYQLCVDYLAAAEDVLRAPDSSTESRVTLRAGQERVRTLQRHHLLTWARGSALSLTREAQQRVRLYEKVETANRALDCIDSALKVYPDEEELNRSAGAVREFIASSRVAHWVELAERASFKGYYRRAIDCYRDALFYLIRDHPDRVREAAAERITREIELLRARLATEKGVRSSMEAGPRPGKGPNRRG